MARSRTAIFAMVLSALCWGDHANASDIKGSYMIYGSGTASCGTWIESRKMISNGVGPQWLAGFLTAFNLYGYWEEDIGKGIDINGLAGWIDNYCKNNPLDNLARASEALITELLVKSSTRPVKPAN